MFIASVTKYSIEYICSILVFFISLMMATKPHTSLINFLSDFFQNINCIEAGFSVCLIYCCIPITWKSAWHVVEVQENFC